MAASIKLHIFIAFYLYTITVATGAKNLKHFAYNGFQPDELRLDGGAIIQPNGLLQLTDTSSLAKAHAFDPTPLKFGTPSSHSFSTTFVFAMYPVPEIQAICGQGIAFVLSPSMDFSYATAAQYFGLFNTSTNGKSSNHIFAVELDSMESVEFGDIDSNHVGIDVNNLRSIASSSAGYFSDAKKRNESLELTSAKPMQIWIDYDDIDMMVKVTLAPLGLPKPSKPLLSTRVNLSQVDTMYVALVASTGAVANSHYVLGWSFSQGRQAQAQSLDLSKLPFLPRFRNRRRKLSKISMIMVIVTSATVTTMGLGIYLRWRKKFEETLEDWEQEYILQRFSYRDLYRATNGFKEKELLGMGGFGKVYKGILPSTKVQVAVKKLSHGFGQGVREFVTEIACMSRLRHRNLVQLLGYCRKNGEMFLVYDFMSNGSLEKYLYNGRKPNLSWSERFKIIKGLASALLYLHEEWEKVVVHRDVKPSNVLLDSNMSVRLGDFGLARLFDRGENLHKTHVVGTLGYIAPELIGRGVATPATDVFSFGITVLEVACGRRSLRIVGGRECNLTDWVYDCWTRGVIIDASDRRLRGSYVPEEMKLVLKLGMICSHPIPEARPDMRQVLQFLNGEATLPALSPVDSVLVASISEGLSTSYSFDSVLVFGR